MAGQQPISLKCHPQLQIAKKNVIFMDHQKMESPNPTIPQKQAVAEPPCRPPSLTLTVHGAREGPVPRAQVSLLWALLCPLPGVSDPLGGADTFPCP